MYPRSRVDVPLRTLSRFDMHNLNMPRWLLHKQAWTPQNLLCFTPVEMTPVYGLSTHLLVLGQAIWEMRAWTHPLQV